MDTPREEDLRKMSYSELKNTAKTCGVKANMKADKIITSILHKCTTADDSFLTLEAQIVNSCKKHKHARFDEDKTKVSLTPRRDTYTIDSHADSLLIKALNGDSLLLGASPELPKTPNVDEGKNVTVLRGSARKSQKRKVSFITPVRRSARISSSFSTPKYTSVKDRPKTPIPSRISSGCRRASHSQESTKSRLGTPCPLYSDKKTAQGLSSISPGGRKVKRPSTPMPVAKKRKMDFVLENSEENASPNSVSVLEVVSEMEPLKEDNERSTRKSKRNESLHVVSEIELLKPEKKTSEQSEEHTSELHSDTKSNAMNASEKSVKKDISPKRTTRGNVSLAVTPSLTSTTKTENNFMQIRSKSHDVTPLPQSTNGKKMISQKKSASLAVTPFAKSANKRTATPKKILTVVTPFRKSATKRKTATPQKGVSLSASPFPKSATKRMNVTPNFNKIHQKAFDKMESIDEYQKRKAANSAKKVKEQRQLREGLALNVQKKFINTKIPKPFSGIPFVPSITSTKNLNLNFASSNAMRPNFLTPNQKRTKSLKTQNESNVQKKSYTPGFAKLALPMSRGNSSLVQKNKFDLKASLAKKLSYRPYRGPLKQLPALKPNSSLPSSALSSHKTVQNEVAKENRVNSRNVLRGVRKNRRFELQMSNRKLLTK